MSYIVCRKGVAAGLVMAIVAFPGIASAGDEWEFEIGAGVGYGSKYEGSDEMEVEFLPVLGITWNDTVFLTTEDGLGVVAYDEYRQGFRERSGDTQRARHGRQAAPSHRQGVRDRLWHLLPRGDDG